MTPLRQKMIDLMTFRQFSPKTHQAYLHSVSLLSRAYHRSPEHITTQEIKDWLIQTANERKWSDSTVHQMFNGLKFCYQQVLERPDHLAGILLPKRAQKIPDLLTRQEVGAILQATTNIKHLTLLSVCYACGLRVSEVVALTPQSIDPDRHLIMIRQSKGKKDRPVPLPDSALIQLRHYWRHYRPEPYLFLSTRKDQPLSISSAQKLYSQAKRTACITKSGGIHSLRHAYATHQIEQGLPIHQLQRILGHQSIHVTLRYLHWTPAKELGKAVDLLAQLPLKSMMNKFEPEEINDEQF